MNSSPFRGYTPMHPYPATAYLALPPQQGFATQWLEQLRVRAWIVEQLAQRENDWKEELEGTAFSLVLHALEVRSTRPRWGRLLAHRIGDKAFLRRARLVDATFASDHDVIEAEAAKIGLQYVSPYIRHA